MIDFSKKTVLQLKQTALRHSNFDIKAIEELEKRGIKIEFSNNIKLLKTELSIIKSLEFGNKYQENLYKARCFLLKSIRELKEPLRLDVVELEKQEKALTRYW